MEVVARLEETGGDVRQGGLGGGWARFGRGAGRPGRAGSGWVCVCVWGGGGREDVQVCWERRDCVRKVENVSE